MPLIKTTSGIRGTLGGRTGESLTPTDVVALTAAFGGWLLQQSGRRSVVVGRDARASGPMISRLVSATLQGLGLTVLDLGPATTPTVAMAVSARDASGGVAITASHNPADWNALKLLNQDGELLDTTAADAVFARAAQAHHPFVSAAQLGAYGVCQDALDAHIAQIVALPLVDAAAIRKSNFRIALDAVNSVGGVAVPRLLQALGVTHTTALHCTPNGQFAHNPEPLPEHLTDLMQVMQGGAHDVGLAVDPDVDRLVVIDERGQPWGEDYTLVAVADYVLRHTPGSTVANLSTSSALQEVAARHGRRHYGTPVGEYHVVAQMKAVQAAVGGEGNGGIIYPPLHYGRDALVGIALLLSYLARTGQTASALRATYPNYAMVKRKVQLTPDADLPALLQRIRQQHGTPHQTNTDDGLKILYADGWVHLRRSNTEPIIRICAEAPTAAQATQWAEQLMGALLS